MKTRRDGTGWEPFAFFLVGLDGDYEVRIAVYTVFCLHCGCVQCESSYRITCAECEGPLDFHYESGEFRVDNACNSIWKFRSLLPIRVDSSPISLGEGQTPLQASRFHEKVSVYYKNEALNPTGSHKDRALSIGVTKALEFGRKVVMLYSDGSTALSSAAYAAKAGLKSITVLPRATPRFRSLPLALYNSRLLEYQGNPKEALDWVHQACRSLGIYETSNYRRANPYESEGAKTIGLEIFEQLGDVPDWIVVPVGGGGTLAGIWRAFVELNQRRMSAKYPHMVAVLPEGYQLLESAWRRRVSTDEELRALTRHEAPPTIQVKIAMPFPPDGLEAITAIRDSEGMFNYASDREAVDAQKRLAAFEGIYAEPSAAVALVAVEKLISTARVSKGQSVVAVITGSGFRETGAIVDFVGSTSTPINADSGIELLQKLLSE